MSAIFNKRDCVSTRPAAWGGNDSVPIDNDDEFDSGEFDSGEFDSGEFDSGEFDSGEFDSGEFDSGVVVAGPGVIEADGSFAVTAAPRRRWDR